MGHERPKGDVGVESDSQLRTLIDATLAERIGEARTDWYQVAQRRLDAAVRREPRFAQLRADAQASLTQARRALVALERATRQLSTCPL